ncbi:hypothetical protein [Pedobacter sp. L105]|uniref:hypothetical protein n=1 Tax=Pedobacter sp. L105 TaxID=1641871 RepID=UPI0020B123CD|nr:hypothetical protein [Pedobacter sp. L105]
METSTIYKNSLGAVIANTNDGIDRTVTVQDNQRAAFDQSMVTASVDGTTDDVAMNTDLSNNIDSENYAAVGSSNQGSSESDMLAMSSTLGSQSTLIDRLGAGFSMQAKNISNVSELSDLTKMSSIAKNTGRVLGVAGAIFTGIESYQNHNNHLTSGDYAKIGIQLAVAFTPYGWAYGIADVGWGLATGETITDNIGDIIDK